MLHIRKKGKEYKRPEKQLEVNLAKELRELMNSYEQSGTSTYDYNNRVLVELIETGHVQELLNSMNKTDYPKFLIAILKESDKNFVKEAVCRMIIKYFGKQKSKDIIDESNAGAGHEDENDKIQFITLVEPLI